MQSILLGQICRWCKSLIGSGVQKNKKWRELEKSRWKWRVQQGAPLRLRATRFPRESDFRPGTER